MSFVKSNQLVDNTHRHGDLQSLLYLQKRGQYTKNADIVVVIVFPKLLLVFVFEV
jgi:hypothetical protein